MRQRLPVGAGAVLAAAALALTGCGRQPDTPPAAPAADTARGGNAPAEPPAPALPGPDAPIPGPVGGDAGERDSGVDVRRFSCESGHRVELVGGDMARVTLDDGRVIELPRERDGVAEYRGEALSFDLADDGSGGVLGQDEVGGFDCVPDG